MNIKFTIITVCYNASATISNTIESVLHQSYQNLEYIVVDGKSTDGTVTLLQDISDSRFSYISEKDTGIFNAMNKGIVKATGNYLIFLGADDVFFDDHVLDQVASKINPGSTDIIYGDVMLKNRQRLYRGEFSRWTWGHQNICHQCIFYPKIVYNKYCYQEKYKSVADWDLNLRLLIDGVRFSYIGCTICTFNDADGLSSNSKDIEFQKVRKELVVKAVGALPYYFGIIMRIKRRLLKQKY